MALLLNAGDAVSRSYSYTQPSPLHPIQPQETGERTGNLCPVQSFEKTALYYTVTLLSPLSAGTYTISAVVTTDSSDCRIAFRREDGTGISASYIIVQSSGRSQLTFTIDESCYYIYFYGAHSTGDNVPVKYEDIMLNSGSTALPYEPYGYKIPISSGGVTTPVYLSEPIRKIGDYADNVEGNAVTRYIKKLVLTGEENWQTYSGANATRYNISPVIIDGVPITKIICSHFSFGGYNASDGNAGEITGTNSTTAFRIFLWSDITSVTAWKAYLAAQHAAGTPVTIWYVLATPTTEQITAPTIPTTAGSQTFDVDTSLKPSSVEITYKGWHKHTPKEYDNGSWS